MLFRSGQMSDTGLIEGEGWVVEVENMARPVAGLIVHRGEVVEGSPRGEGRAIAKVDHERRKSITRNHKIGRASCRERV